MRLIWLLVALTFTATGCEMSEAEKKEKAMLEKKAPGLWRFYLRNRSVFGDVEARWNRDRQASKCDVAAILEDVAESRRAAAKKEGLKLRTVSWEFFQRFHNRRGIAIPENWNKGEGDWAWLTDPEWRKHFDDAPADMSDDAGKKASRFLTEEVLTDGFYLLLRPSVSGLPRVQDKTPTRASFGGWVYVYDTAVGARRCAIAINVKTSPPEKIKAMKNYAKDPKAAVIEDFRMQFDAELKKVLPKGITHRTKLVK